MSPSSLADETPQERIYDNLAPFGASIFKQVREVQRKLLLEFAVLQTVSVEDNQHTKRHILGWPDLKHLQVQRHVPSTLLSTEEVEQEKVGLLVRRRCFQEDQGDDLGDGVWWELALHAGHRECQADLPPASSMPLPLDFHRTLDGS